MNKACGKLIEVGEEYWCQKFTSSHTGVSDNTSLKMLDKESFKKLLQKHKLSKLYCGYKTKWKHHSYSDSHEYSCKSCGTNKDLKVSTFSKTYYSGDNDGDRYQNW